MAECLATSPMRGGGHPKGVSSLWAPAGGRLSRAGLGWRSPSPSAALAAGPGASAPQFPRADVRQPRSGCTGPCVLGGSQASECRRRQRLFLSLLPLASPCPSPPGSVESGLVRGLSSARGGGRSARPVPSLLLAVMASPPSGWPTLATGSALG